MITFKIFVAQKQKLFRRLQRNLSLYLCSVSRDDYISENQATWRSLWFNAKEHSRYLFDLIPQHLSEKNQTSELRASSGEMHLRLNCSTVCSWHHSEENFLHFRIFFRRSTVSFLSHPNFMTTICIIYPFWWIIRFPIFNSENGSVPDITKRIYSVFDKKTAFYLS